MTLNLLYYSILLLNLLYYFTRDLPEISLQMAAVFSVTMPLLILSLLTGQQPALALFPIIKPDRLARLAARKAAVVVGKVQRDFDALNMKVSVRTFSLSRQNLRLPPSLDPFTRLSHHPLSPLVVPPGGVAAHHATSKPGGQRRMPVD